MSLFLTQYQAIFLHIPKCAGQSIGKSFSIKHNHRHHKLNDLPEDLDNYLRFTFIRHPVSRFISAHNYNKLLAYKTIRAIEAMPSALLSPAKQFRLNLIKTNPDINNVVDDLCLGKMKKILFFKPQSNWILRGKPQFVGRVENIEDDFEKLRSLLGFKNKLVHTNTSKSLLSETEITKHNLQRLIDYYEADFKLTGYTKSWPNS
jgi:hypothetical protein